MDTTAAAPQDTMTEVRVDLARLETKVDGITDRLDRQNGSIARLQEKSNHHDTMFAKLAVQGDLISKVFSKPVLMVIIVIASLLAGHAVTFKQIAEFFK